MEMGVFVRDEWPNAVSKDKHDRGRDQSLEQPTFAAERIGEIGERGALERVQIEGVAWPDFRDRPRGPRTVLHKAGGPGLES